MRKATKLYMLLGVLLAVCVAAFAVSRYEEKKEQIKNSGEVILEIPTDSVTALCWTNDGGTFSFTNDEAWVYDEDSAFPVDEEKIHDLLEQFASFSAAFSIDDVEDYAQYGLDEPVCTIEITAGEECYTVSLGDFSKMDEQRYISIGDGKAYLAIHDPLEEYDAVLQDMILDDTIPDFDTAEEITFAGEEAYTILRDEDGKSICDDDIYFTDGLPLDSDSVDSYLRTLRGLSLGSYVSYHASDEELEQFGLTKPDLTICVQWSAGDNEAETGTLELAVSSDPEEAAAYAAAVENGDDSLPSVSHYIRVGASQIVYPITQSVYDQLTAVSYDTLRHQKLFTADFDTVTAIEVSLDGELHTFTYLQQEDKDGEKVWTYNGEEFDVSQLKTALRAISASSFTEETPTGQEEISLTVQLDNEDFPTFTLTLYRLDGTSCIAAVDGSPVALVSRSQTVDLIEAVNELTLGN